MFDSIFNNYTISEYPNAGIIELGKSVLGGADALKFTSLLEEMSEKGLKHIIIDLHNVEIINSSGLGMLVSGLSTVKKYYIGIYFVQLPQKIVNLLEMTHLDSIFQVYDTIETALKTVKEKNNS